MPCGRPTEVNVGKTYDSIAAGLEQAVAFSKGHKVAARVHAFSPLDIKRIREATGLTQREFAATFGISLGTLRHWERGDRAPRGPALVLLTVMARDPRAILQAIAV